MLRNLVYLGVCLLLAFACNASAADCKAVEGDYVLNMSGFGGGSNYFYPIAMIGNLTIAKDGAMSGNYKIHIPFQTGTQANRNVTGKLSVSKCIGTLKVTMGDQTLHTFTVIVNKEGGLALATGEVGLVVSGTATQ